MPHRPAAPPPVFGALLAAGRGRRFGGGKLVAELRPGCTLFDAAATALLESSLDDVVAVLPPGDARLARLAGSAALRAVVNPDPDGEMGSSIACGARAFLAHRLMAPGAGLLVSLADMPWITPRLVDRLAAAYRDAPGRIVIPVRGGRRGHPVIFPFALADELLALGGERSGRTILAAHPALVLEAPVDTDAIFRDIDTPADLAAASSGDGA